jgi:hypothetical protein
MYIVLESTFIVLRDTVVRLIDARLECARIQASRGPGKADTNEGLR